MLDFEINNIEMTSDNLPTTEIESKINEILQSGEYENHENVFSDILAEYGIEMSDNPVGSTYLENLENFNPYEGNDIYNAGEAMEVWECQGNTNRCAQFSQMFVIEEFTGMDLDPDAFCEFSEMNGWFDEAGGTTLDNMNKMLDYFGIDNEASYDNSEDDLLECLENGGRAIVALDSGEYANGEGFWDDLSDFGSGADHAVEVIGYNPETDSVILNDSGLPNGCGEEIPLDTFLDAWNDSGNFMIECYNK